MKTPVAMAVLAIFSGSALAHETRDSCDINFDGEISLVNDVLTVTTEKKDSISIGPMHNLTVNGEDIVLNSEQRTWVSQYYDGIYTSVPKVAEIAVEGIAIATEAITHVFDELLDSDSSAVRELTSKLDELNQKIQYNFYADDGSIHLNSANFENGNLFGEEWENEFEQAVEDMVMSSMGQLMIAIGSEMLWSGGNMEAFEARMENFAANIEEKVEFRGEQLEQKAEALCVALIDVDNAENNLQSSIPELAGLNILNVRENAEAM